VLIKEKYPNTILSKLFGDKTYIAPIWGPSNRLAVAEAAGAEENAAGLPLVGGSGKIFDSLLRKSGIRRDDISIINTLPCQPPNNLYPTDPAARVYCTSAEGQEAVAYSYKHYVEPVLKARPWTRIDAIGEKSLRLLTGKTEGIMKWRGCPLPLKGEDKARVIAILHPAYLMRDSAMIPATISDLTKGVQIPPQHYNTKPTVEDLEGFNARTLILDIETNRFTQQITMVGIADARRAYHVVVVPFHGAYIAELKRIFLEAEELVGQNIIGFDLDHLATAGVKVNPSAQIYDIMLMHHLIQPDAPHDLEFIASIFTQMVAWKHLNVVDMAWYNACDVDATAQIFAQLRPLLKQFNLEKLYKFVQVPLAKICKMISETGIKVDPNRIHAAREKFLAEFNDLQNQLPDELKPYDKTIRVRKPAPKGTLGKSGKPVKFIHVPGIERVEPWNSPKCVEHWLYTTMSYPKQLHPKTKKVTTSKSALERLYRKDKNPQLDALKKLQSLDTLLNTSLAEGEKNEQVTRVHANFLVHGTNTGRLSSSNPNMQNITPRARYIYVPSFADWCFVEADFASLENRLAAWYAGDDERLARLSQPGFNEHRWLTSQIYNIPESEITKEMWQYKRGKNTNHGADGAMGPRKLAMTYDVPEKEARELLFKWREINHKSAEWQERVGNEAQRNGILTNAFGRKRWFWSQSSYTEGIRFNPQSTGADICFRAMISLYYERIGWPVELALQSVSVLSPLPHPARLVLQIHDSLLVECPYNLREEVVECMRRAMTQPWLELAGFSIPVDIKSGNPGDSWAELEHI
jgi:uracil-DNA glycosylase family 4